MRPQYPRGGLGDCRRNRAGSLARKCAREICRRESAFACFRLSDFGAAGVWFAVHLIRPAASRTSAWHFSPSDAEKEFIFQRRAQKNLERQDRCANICKICYGNLPARGQTGAQRIARGFVTARTRLLRAQAGLVLLFHLDGIPAFFQAEFACLLLVRRARAFAFRQRANGALTFGPTFHHNVPSKNACAPGDRTALGGNTLFVDFTPSVCSESTTSASSVRGRSSGLFRCTLTALFSISTDNTSSHSFCSPSRRLKQEDALPGSAIMKKAWRLEARLISPVRNKFPLGSAIGGTVEGSRAGGRRPKTFRLAMMRYCKAERTSKPGVPVESAVSLLTVLAVCPPGQTNRGQQQTNKLTIRFISELVIMELVLMSDFCSSRRAVAGPSACLIDRTTDSDNQCPRTTPS